MRATNKDISFYTFDDIARIFHKDKGFAKRLLTKGMPGINMGGTWRVLDRDFWYWLDMPEPDDPFEAFITVTDIKNMFGLSKIAAYRFKNTMPKDMTVRVGNLIFIKQTMFINWLTKKMEEKANGKEEE